MPKTTDSTLPERRCVRKYAAQAVSAENLAFRNTPTGSHARRFSLIVATQRALKDELAVLIGRNNLNAPLRISSFCATSARCVAEKNRPATLQNTGA